MTRYVSSPGCDQACMRTRIKLTDEPNEARAAWDAYSLALGRVVLDTDAVIDVVRGHGPESN